MTTDILEFDTPTTATSTASGPAAPASSASSTPEAAAVASGSQASESTSASAAPSASYTTDGFDVMESQLDLRDPPPTRSADAAVASPATPAANDAAAATPASEAAARPTGLEAFSTTDLDTARHFGITDAELKSIKTPDVLQLVLTALDRRELSAAKPTQSQPAATAEDRPATTPNDATAAPASPAAADSEFKLDKLELDLTGWDDEAAAMFRKINDHHQAQLEKLAAKQSATPQAPADVVALKEQLAALEAKAAHAERVQFEQSMDRYFEGLDKAYVDMFGTGPMRSLAKDSPQSKARNELVQEFIALRESDARLGRPAMPDEAILKRALAARFADQVQELARKQVRAEVEERRQQAVEKPTQRTVPIETGDAAAANFVNSFYKDRGIDTGDSLLSALAEIE